MQSNYSYVIIKLRKYQIYVTAQISLLTNYVSEFRKLRKIGHFPKKQRQKRSNKKEDAEIFLARTDDKHLKKRSPSFSICFTGCKKGENLLNTELKNTISTTNTEAQYDACAKRLLSQKIILAHILVKTINEFKGMKPSDVLPYIEGEPMVSKVPADPGLTNMESQTYANQDDAPRIIGMNTESKELNEGVTFFDIIFYVQLMTGRSQIIINVEAQKNEPTKYDILNRSIFYVSRMISSQKERDFIGSNYNDMKQVFSIWICMNMKTHSMSHIGLTETPLIGEYVWKGKLDLLNIVMIGLADYLPEHDDIYELHRLLGTLLSEELTVNDKINIIETEYNIPMEENEGKDVDSMSNLGEGIRERAQEKQARLTAINLSKLGMPSEQIAAVSEMSLDKIKTWIKEAHIH